MRFRKSYILALAISFGVFCVTGFLALIIAREIPSSPLAQQFKFMKDSNFNPAVYTSYRYAQTEQQVATLDFWITLLAMGFAGFALGLKMAARSRLLETLVYGIVSAIILSGITLTLSWLGTVATEQSALNETGVGPNTKIDWHYLQIAAGTVFLWASVYVAGAIAGHGTRLRVSPPKTPSKSSKPSKRKVASTTP